MSAFCPVEQLKKAVGEKEFSPELALLGDFTILSVEGKLFLLPKSPMAIERVGVSFLQRVGRFGLSRYELDTLAFRLLDHRDYLPLDLRHRLDGTIMARPQLVADALERGDIPLYRINKPTKSHAPAKSLSLPVFDEEVEEAPPPAQTGIPKPKTQTHWIEFCYQYEDNKKPIANVPFVLTMPDGSEINGTLPDNGKVWIDEIKQPGEASIVYGEPSAEQEADQLRAEIKQALDTIIQEERAEAAEIEDWYDDHNFVSKAYIRQYYLGKGVVNGAWGLLQWVGDVAEAASTFGYIDSMIQASIQDKYDYQNDEWKADFVKNVSLEHKKKLVKVLGFDPSSISRENIADAYEAYTLIKNDPESRELIWSFIKDYAGAQHELEVAEGSGELGFEFILAAVLAAFTGGTGAAVLAPRLGSKMSKLGKLFQKLAASIKKLKLRKTVKGNTNKSTTTGVKRPEKKPIEPKRALTNKEIRAWYNERVSVIPKLNEKWKRQGLSAEHRAKNAYKIRHDARLKAREMMYDKTEVKMLEQRDLREYGNKDGPTFEHLYKKYQEKGFEGDEIYESIIGKSNSTNKEYNQKFNIDRGGG